MPVKQMVLRVIPGWGRKASRLLQLYMYNLPLGWFVAFLSLPPPALPYNCSRRIELLLKAMAKDYQQLWKDVISVTNGSKAVRTSAEILVEEGRAS